MPAHNERLSELRCAVLQKLVYVHLQLDNLHSAVIHSAELQEHLAAPQCEAYRFVALAKIIRLVL